MKKNILNEINDMKYLFNYSRGKVISEQEQFESEDADLVDNLDMFMDDEDDDEDEDINYLKGEMAEDEDMEDYSDEVPSFDLEGMFKGMSKPNGDMEFSENTTREKERIKVDPGTKPKQPKTPYKPKPGPKPDPKAKNRKNDIPDWLSFDELGIDFE
jgi:hypothetical protein